MSSLDDIIGECQKIAEVERIQKMQPDPLCLIVKVRARLIDRKQIQHVKKVILECFEVMNVPAPPIIVCDDQIDVTAIPKSRLVEDTCTTSG